MSWFCIQVTKWVPISTFPRPKLLHQNYEPKVLCQLCTNTDDKMADKNLKKEENSQDGNIILPEEPTNCCMSGCANCVWITYADELTKLFNDGGQKARDTVLQKVTDPSMKMFLLMELKSLEEENKKS